MYPFSCIDICSSTAIVEADEVSGGVLAACHCTCIMKVEVFYFMSDNRKVKA